MCGEETNLTKKLERRLLIIGTVRDTNVKWTSRSIIL
jgi:hypothetical protein